MQWVPLAPNALAGNPRIGIGFTDSGDALVGVNDDDQIVLGRAAGVRVVVGHKEDVRVDPGDLHGRDQGSGLDGQCRE